jgi:hypothetical protein
MYRLNWQVAALARVYSGYLRVVVKRNIDDIVNNFIEDVILSSLLANAYRFALLANRKDVDGEATTLS